MNLPTPSKTLYVIKEPNGEVALRPGPLRFSFSVPVVNYNPPYAETFMETRLVDQPVGSYLVVQIKVDLSDPMSRLKNAALQCAELVGLFDLRYPQVVLEKVFQGVANTTTSRALIQEGPLPLVPAVERDPAEVVARVREDVNALRKLPPDARERYRLAARWFRRGHEAINPVDKLLFWWTVLEIFPAEGSKNVVAKTVDLLAASIYRDIIPQQIKTRTKIGRIHGLRSDIVHHGKAFVTNEEEDRFSDFLNRLHATVVTCLRLLLELPPGNDLDEFVLGL